MFLIQIAIISTTSSFVFQSTAGAHIPGCTTEKCLTQASRILKYVDPNEDPCENFYQFSCGNYLKEAHGNEKLGLSYVLEEKAKTELLRTYYEAIRENEHKMIKAAKKLFAACMNEAEIERDNLRTIKEDLKVLGGWPVLEGPKWADEKFDWIRTVFKLRELGYYYSVFLDLVIEPDKEDSSHYALKVLIKHVDDYGSYMDDIEIMTDIAMIFGAQNREDASKDMNAVHELEQNLKKLDRSEHTKHQKLRVKEFQQKHSLMDWLEFINNLIGPAASISKDDYVWFPPADLLTDMINLLSKTPKRVLSNYIIWKVIEETLPHLTKNLRSLKEVSMETREDYCLSLMDKSFVVNPLDIIHARKYISPQRESVIEQMLLNLKAELTKTLSEIEWMDREDKQKLVEKVNGINLVIGQPGNYHDNKIIDELDVDMVEATSQTFLSLLTQANRNHQSAIYRKIKQPVPIIADDAWYFRIYRGLPYYHDMDNVMFIPTVNAHTSLFDENQPQYLNYGGLGFVVGQRLYNFMAAYVNNRDKVANKWKGWSNATKEAFGQELQCVKKQMEEYSLKQGIFELSYVIQHGIGGKIAYEAYEDWIKANDGKDELQLGGLDYTPRQLFWISAASTVCQPVQPDSTLHSMFKEPNFFSNIVSVSMRNNPNFAKDFSCSTHAKMNPSNRCKIF